MKIRPFAGIIAIILVSLITLCSCNIIPAGDSGIVTGYVKLEDGISPKDVQVSLSGYDLDYVSYAVNPDENGYFRIEDVYPYTYTVSYFKKDYYKTTKDNVSVSAGKTVNLGTVTLSVKYGSITGKVTDESGTPLSGAKVTVSGNGLSYSTNSGADGNFTIEAKPGKYTDIAFAYPDHNLKDSIKISVNAEKTTTLSTDYKLPESHNYVLQEVKASTTAVAGYRKYRCSDCGYEYMENLPLLTDGAKWAGIRASSYGLEESFGSYPGITDMLSFGAKMESCYSGSTGTYILIVGVVDEETWACHLDFPLSKEIPNAFGSDYDLFEDYLNAFDNAGYSVWLQVEPGNADLVELAKEVMNRYKHHSCVKGFGIDVEWYQPEDTDEQGTPLDKSTASKVLTAVRNTKKDANYTVFVKHWERSYLTEGEPVSGFIYISDSQGFYKGKNSTYKETMCNEFARWAETFAPCPVMFQIGYENKIKPEKDDKAHIWGSMDNPAEELGKAIIEKCQDRNLSNDIGIIWVDFTLKEVIEKIPVAD